jgi:hypothetical protein
LTLKDVLRAIGIILVMPACLLIFLVGWPLYVLFDVPILYDDDDE